MADFLLSVGVDVGLSFDQMQKDISDLVSQLNQNPQRVRVGLEIDHSAIERFRTEVANIHNSMGGLGRVTVNPVDTSGLNNAVDGIARLSQNAQGAISTVQTMSAALNDVNTERIQQAIASISGISADGAAALAQSLGEASVRATEVRARLLEAADAEQQLVALQVRGTNATGHIVNYLMTYNAETGEITRRMVDVTARLEDASASEERRATTVREISDLYRQMHALMRTNANASNTQSYAELANQARLLDDALRLARTESISIDEALTRLGTSGVNAISGARDAMSAFRLEMEQTGSSGSLSLTTMYNTIAQIQTLLNNNAGYANLGTYTNLQTQVSLLAQAIELASNDGITLEAALTRVGLNGSTAIHNAREAMSAFKAEMSGATAEEERLTVGSVHYRAALDKINTLLRQVRANTEKWTAAKTGKSREDYRVYADQARELENLAQRVGNCTITLREFNAEYGRIKSTASTAETAMRGAGEATRTWSERIGGLASKFGTWFSITRVIMEAYRAIREMVSAVIELDTAMTELKKVTDETDATYEKFLSNAATRAKRLGASLTDVVKTSADFARLGLSLDDAETVSDAALVYKNVGDGIEDIDQASESLISTMQAFGIKAEDVMKIVDKFNVAGNNFAISSGGVGDALLNSASALAAANNTLDESIALITAANETIQNPEKVGTALKTLSMYIRAAKTEAEEAGISTEGMANSVSELREEILSLTGNRVDIMLDDDSFKSTYQIIEELSKIWGTLRETTRANITELIGGGVKNANVVNALMANMSTAAEVVEKTSNSAGSAMAENAKVLESIQGKLSVFKATFQELSQSFISSGFVKNVIDFGAELLRILLDVGVLIEKLGGLNNILMVTAGVIAIIKADALVSLLGKILAGIIGIIPALQSLVISLFELPLAMQIAKAEGQGLAAALDLVGISASTAQIAIAALVAILTVAIICISNYNRELEQTRRTNIDNANAVKQEADSLRDLIDQYKQLAEAEKWDATERDQVKSIQDQITKLVGIQADNLDLVNGKLDEEIKKLDEIALKTAEGNTGKLLVAKKSAEDSLIQSSYHGKWNSFAQTEQERATINVGAYAAASEIHAVRDVLNEVGLDEYWGSGNGMFQIDISSIDSILQSYNDMIKLQEYLVANYEKEISTGGNLNDFYYELSSRINQMSTAVDDYNNAISNYNQNEAVKDLGSYLKTTDIDSQDAFDNYINSVRNSTEYSESYKDVLIQLATDTFPQFAEAESEAVGGSSGGWENKLSDLAEAAGKLKASYDLIDTAQKEMADGDGGLSVDTIKALAEDAEDYIDYLYEENGVIKLNTEAWRERSNAQMEGNIIAIENQIATLEEERSTIESNISALQDATIVADDFVGPLQLGAYHQSEWNIAMDEQNSLLEANSKALTTNQNKLGIYQTLYTDITGSLDAYSLALKNFTNISNAITSVSDALTTVADIQEAVAKGFTISLEKALEFAKVYPEILNGASIAADGQIALNKDVVNNFISGKEAELKAQIDAEVAKLEADKKVLTAKMEFSKAQLELAKSVGTGEGQISKEVAEYRVNAGNAVAQALIAAGIDEATAYQLACAAMAQNSEEFNRVAAEVCTDVQGNFNQAAYDAAQAIYTNMQNSKLSIASVAAQAHEAAKAIAGIASGTVRGSSSVQGGGAGGSYTGKGNITVHSGSFQGTEYTYEAKTISLEDFISDLELDISNYSKAISQIDGQIATLKALRNTSLEKFASSNKAKNKKKSGSKNKEASWFEKEYALHQHLLKMDAENVDDYLDWLNDAYQRAYKEGVIDLNDYYKYQEEVYTGLQDLFKDYLSDVEHEISMRQNYDGEAKKIIQLYEGLINNVEKEIAAARARGLTDEDDYIQELQKKWQDYTGSITDLRDELTSDAKDALAELIDYRIDMLKREVDEEKDALDKKLDNLKEFYDRQKELLQDQRDEEKYLDEQTEKRKTILDLKSELDMLGYDDSAWAQKRRLELQAELAEAQKDLDEFEKDHALDLALDALDKAYNDQESQLQAEMDALEERLNDPEALYNKALEDIRKNSENQLYYQMLMYNRQFGDGNDETVIELWESAYGALTDYEKLFGALYKGVRLENETGVKSDGGWDSEVISGTNPNNKKPAQSTATSKPSTNESGSKAPALTNGSSIQVKRSATHFGSKSGGVRMASQVPGGTYTVYKTSDGQVLIGRNGVYTGWIKKSDIVGYRSGTNHSIGGLAQFDEEGDGSEYIFESSDGNRYRMFAEGSKVLNAKAADFLYNFATTGGNFLTKTLTDLLGLSGLGNMHRPAQSIEVYSGDIIVQGNASERTVSEIRRAQRDSLEFVLKELNKLNK